MSMKRIMDIFLSTVALIVFLPVIAFFSFLVWLQDRKSPFYIAPRVGKNGIPFRMIKLRSMTVDADSYNINSTSEDDARITSVGKIIRQYKIDELVQLVNVLKGDMSIVGPRPLLIEYLPLYSEYQARRHDVMPGITGWAQINGRNSLTWDEKFNLDVWYVENHSIWLDVKIIFKTFIKVLDKSGINDDIGVGQEKFKGNNIN